MLFSPSDQSVGQRQFWNSFLGGFLVRVLEYVVVDVIQGILAFSKRRQKGAKQLMHPGYQLFGEDHRRRRLVGTRSLIPLSSVLAAIKTVKP